MTGASRCRTLCLVVAAGCATGDQGDPGGPAPGRPGRRGGSGVLLRRVGRQQLDLLREVRDHLRRTGPWYALVIAGPRS